MLFNSIEFLLFFPVVTVLYFLAPYRTRWAVLLAASCYFYMFFKAIYILILFFTIVIDYYAGLFLERAQDQAAKRRLLLLSLAANIGVLAVFKYYNFLNGNLSGILTWMGYENPVPFLQILLPIGLSFHTFQAMSYTIEVYRGHQKAERHFGIYALYVMFYPQLVAGPIERPQNLLHQFHERHDFNGAEAEQGLYRILVGFLKKVVVADRLAPYVDSVYNNYQEHSSASLIVASLFFAVQIYCDFSGYSDIALGSARVMGFGLMENFRRPYFAQSIQEFWSRWHISLSTWFRDYVYFPLGGSRVSRGRWYGNLFVVFLISGLWHGANWTFIVWGALNGLYLVAGHAAQPGWDRLFGALRVQNTMLVVLFNRLWTLALATFAWVFFRANSLAQAEGILTVIASGKPGFYVGIPSAFVYGVGAIFMLFLCEWAAETRRDWLLVLKSPWPAVRLGGVVLLLFIVMLFGVFDGGQFIYFQF